MNSFRHEICFLSLSLIVSPGLGRANGCCEVCSKIRLISEMTGLSDEKKKIPNEETEQLVMCYDRNYHVQEINMFGFEIPVVFQVTNEESLTSDKS